MSTGYVGNMADEWKAKGYLTTAYIALNQLLIAGDLVSGSKRSTAILFSLPITKYHFDASFLKTQYTCTRFEVTHSCESATLNCTLFNAGQTGFSEQPPLLTLYALCSFNISQSHLILIYLSLILCIYVLYICRFMFSTSSLRIVFKLLYVMSLYLFSSFHLFLFVSLHI